MSNYKKHKHVSTIREKEMSFNQIINLSNFNIIDPSKDKAGNFDRKPFIFS